MLEHGHPVPISIDRQDVVPHPAGQPRNFLAQELATSLDTSDTLRSVLGTPSQESPRERTPECCPVRPRCPGPAWSLAHIWARRLGERSVQRHANLPPRVAHADEMWASSGLPRGSKDLPLIVHIRINPGTTPYTSGRHSP
jgi:hypothetical protein